MDRQRQRKLEARAKRQASLSGMALHSPEDPKNLQDSKKKTVKDKGVKNG